MSTTLNFRHGALALTVNLFTNGACAPADPVIVETAFPALVEPGLPMGAQILIKEYWEESYSGRRILCVFRATLAPIAEYRSEIDDNPNWMGAKHGFMNIEFDGSLSDEDCQYYSTDAGKVMLKVTFDGVTATWEGDTQTFVKGAQLYTADGQPVDSALILSDGPNMQKMLCYARDPKVCKGLGTGECVINADCSGDQVCNPNGMCVNPPPTGCDDDNDCPEGQVCINRMCVPPNDGCNGNDANCPDGQICDPNTDKCIPANKFPACFRPAGDTPDPNDNPNLPGTGLNVGTNFKTMDWNIYTGMVEGNLCVELPMFSLPVTIDDSNAPVHPDTQKKLCWAADNRFELECDTAALASLSDVQSGDVTGWYYMDSPYFNAPVYVGTTAWNVPVD